MRHTRIESRGGGGGISIVPGSNLQYAASQSDRRDKYTEYLVCTNENDELEPNAILAPRR